ncbi:MULTISPECIES: amidohydrolase family protein [Zobellia]|uniref:Amidohydrolase 2 family protein n=1 Tax=Zobellia galactanivorans (strain DSM 12802 / CCUG 47099 / CIP 106680 / NCIMB 13871 / Dsij) TaxID=63186 RepID=G0L716_ZOBGA|nr:MULTISPECIES: amidohydrolase family protein [Zobellia]MBU3025637.1 amidohydrolase family protein [Zobellia galactanivorans]OWW24959.1 amidohydrolase [Zobellia sp. OII3]CAZ98818.1 Amidohydrolase 2 family protein [Zobellia galactanivorans]
MTIDSHQHFWNYEAVKHSWIDDEMSSIRKDFLPEDLKKVYQENGIDGCVAVQADQTLEETDFLLELAKQNDFIKGVVGWADLRSGHIDSVLEKYSSEQFLKGWRHVVQGEADHNFLLRPNFLRGISLLEKYGYTYDILVFPHQLGAVLEFVRKFPNQRFVIDHIAKPYIKDGFYDGWASLMKEIGKQENVCCKLSGMITEADYNSWTPEQLHPYMHLVLEAFGSERVMFGSDWPVCLVAGNYGQVKGVVTDFISTLGEEDQQMIMGANAEAFYNL